MKNVCSQAKYCRSKYFTFEQSWLYFSGDHSGVRNAWSLVFCVVFCKSLFVLFSGFRVAWSLVLSVWFVDRCLSFCTFSFCHCVVCSSIYVFWLSPLVSSDSSSYSLMCCCWHWWNCWQSFKQCFHTEQGEFVVRALWC